MLTLPRPARSAKWSVIMANTDLSSLLSSQCISSHLFPKLTIPELLNFTQISQECRHSLQHETTWQSALMRSLPAGHPLRSPTTSYQTAAYQYGALQHAINSGGADAILRSATAPCTKHPVHATSLERLCVL